MSLDIPVCLEHGKFPIFYNFFSNRKLFIMEVTVQFINKGGH